MIKQAIKTAETLDLTSVPMDIRSFNDLLLEAEKRGLLKLEADEKSGRLHGSRRGLITVGLCSAKMRWVF